VSPANALSQDGSLRAVGRETVTRVLRSPAEGALFDIAACFASINADTERPLVTLEPARGSSQSPACGAPARLPLELPTGLRVVHSNDDWLPTGHLRGRRPQLLASGEVRP